MPIIMAVLVLLMLVLFSKLTWLIVPFTIITVVAVLASKARRG